MFDQSDVEAVAEAEWTRCRSLADRKSRATWASISEAERDAWRGGAHHALMALDSHRAASQEYPFITLNDGTLARMSDRINDYCAEAWPEAHSGGYDPRCCRFPKSCSATILERGDGIHCTEKDENHLAGAVACAACTHPGVVNDHFEMRYYIDPKSGLIDSVPHETWPELLGQALLKVDYPILYEILTEAGQYDCPWGEDELTFNLPDLQAKVVE